MSLFIGIQLLLVVLQIHKHTTRAQISYNKQKNEKRKQGLLIKRQEMMQQLYGLKNYDAIKEFAQKELHMKQITLSQIKKMPVNDDKNIYQ